MTTATEARDRLRAASYRTGHPQYAAEELGVELSTQAVA